MSATIDQQFVEFIVKTLVSNPDAVEVKRSIDEKGVLLELTVDPEDLGRVIGKRGAAAQSLRTLLRALGTKNDARYNLKIVDVSGGERPEKKPYKKERNSEEHAPYQPKEKEENKQASEPVVPSRAETKESDEEEETGKSNFEKTRRELADLDDLDI